MSISKMAEAARLARSKRNELRERELQAQSLAAPGPAKSEPGKSTMPLAPVNNKLLAGLMAHEFLTSGTLLGRRMKPSHGGPGPVAAPVADREDELAAKRKYTEVSQLLMSSKSGTHIPGGIVNPTQLARWLQIKGSPPAGHPSPDKEDPARLSG